MEGWGGGGGGAAGGRPHPCGPQLCAEDVKDFLEHVAVVRVSRGWEFALPYDEDFVRKHPDVARRQHMLWAGIQAKYGAAGAGRPRGVCPSRPGDSGGTGLRRGGRGGAPRPGVGPRGPPRHEASGDRRPGAGTLCSDRGWPRALELSPALSRLEKVYNLVKETTPKQPEGQSGVAGAPPPQASASGPQGFCTQGPPDLGSAGAGWWGYGWDL